MAAFKTVHAAKDYLASLIAEEAEREGSPLSQIERNMLYFTEESGIPQEMVAVHEQFERDYGDDAYEARIGGLVRAVYARDDPTGEQTRQTWNEAITKLADEDHYILGLIDAAEREPVLATAPAREIQAWLPTLERRGPRDPVDLVRLALIGIGIFVLMLIALTVLAIVR